MPSVHPNAASRPDRTPPGRGARHGVDHPDAGHEHDEDRRRHELQSAHRRPSAASAPAAAPPAQRTLASGPVPPRIASPSRSDSPRQRSTSAKPSRSASRNRERCHRTVLLRRRAAFRRTPPRDTGRHAGGKHRAKPPVQGLGAIGAHEPRDPGKLGAGGGGVRLEPLDALAQQSPAGGRDPVAASQSPVDDLLGIHLQGALADQPIERRVEGAGAQRDAPLGELGDRADDGVAVERRAREDGEHEQGGFSDHAVGIYN